MTRQVGQIIDRMPTDGMAINPDELFNLTHFGRDVFMVVVPKTFAVTLDPRFVARAVSDQSAS
jgi:hypothetical protein